MYETVQAEALKVGARVTDISHDRDALGTQVLRVRTEGAAAGLRAALDRYAFKSEVLGEDSARAPTTASAKA
jgi:hypothetical protein